MKAKLLKKIRETVRRNSVIYSLSKESGEVTAISLGYDKSVINGLFLSADERKVFFRNVEHNHWDKYKEIYQMKYKSPGRVKKYNQKPKGSE